MNEFFFVHAERWFLLLIPLALLALGLLAGKRRRRERERFADVIAHPILLADATPRSAAWPLALEITGLLLLAFAALEPAWGWTLEKMQRRGSDIVVCLDTSRSMLAEDLAPSRLARAKRDLKAVLGELQGDRIALIAFAGDTRIVCPLTHDLGAFEALLDGVDTTSTRRGGTDLGAAMRAALALLPVEGSKTQTILLLSDGEDLEGKGQAEARLVRERSVRLHTIGYGSPQGAKIPGPAGQGFLKDEKGADVISQLDAEGLRALAKSCAGDYLQAAELPLPLVEIFEKRVRPLAKRRFDAEDRRRPRTRFQFFLLPGLVLLLLALVLGDRVLRTDRRESRTRASVS